MHIFFMREFFRGSEIRVFLPLTCVKVDFLGERVLFLLNMGRFFLDFFLKTLPLDHIIVVDGENSMDIINLAAYLAALAVIHSGVYRFEYSNGSKFRPL